MEKDDTSKLKAILNKFENYTSKTNQEFINKKRIILSDFILSKRGCKYLTDEDFLMLRENAISEGGFLDLYLRKELWKLIFSINQGNTKFNHEITRINSNIKLNCRNGTYFIQEKSDYMSSRQIEEVIEKDVSRSLISHLDHFKDSLIFIDDLEGIKNNFFRYLKAFFQMNTFVYDYYQGFHDIAILIWLIYIENKKTAFSMTQRIAEFYLKDYLDKNESIFITAQSILIETIQQIDQEIFYEIEKDSGREFTSICLSWVICLFSHKINNMNILLRIWDYIFTSHPSSVYYLAATLIIEEWNIYKQDEQDNDKLFIQHLSELDLYKKNFDDLIRKSENALKKFSNVPVLTYHNELISESPLKCSIKNPLLLLHRFYKNKFEETWSVYHKLGPQFWTLFSIVWVIILLICIFIKYYFRLSK